MITLPKLTLYHYWRSSSSWRVRWAFALKNIPCEFVHVGLLDGESESPAHLRRNPLGYVPALAVHNGKEVSFLIESMAMMEWAEEMVATPSILPGHALNRARARGLAELINADTHPLQNLPAQALHSDNPEERKKWARHWIQNGLSAYEEIVQNTAGTYSVGNELSIADLCLIPQCYNAERYEIDLLQFPTISRIRETALRLESCRKSAPDQFEPQGKS